MWGRKPTPKIKPERPEHEDMSLFTDTLRKLDEKEAELAAAQERIRNLEIALKAARADRFNAMKGRAGIRISGMRRRAAHSDLNTLSAEDEQALFRSLEVAKIDDQVEAWQEPAAEDGNEPTKRRGFLSPVLRMCALLRGK